jgi:hypothetical protein
MENSQQVTASIYLINSMVLPLVDPVSVLIPSTEKFW